MRPPTFAAIVLFAIGLLLAYGTFELGSHLRDTYPASEQPVERRFPDHRPIE